LTGLGNFRVVWLNRRLAHYRRGDRHHADEFCFGAAKAEKVEELIDRWNNEDAVWRKAVVKEALRRHLAEWLKISSAGGWQPEYAVVELRQFLL